MSKRPENRRLIIDKGKVEITTFGQNVPSLCHKNKADYVLALL